MLGSRCVILEKERKNDRNSSNLKHCFYLSNVLLKIQVYLVYLGALWLLTAVYEKLIQGKSDLAAGQGLTCITQLQAFSCRKEGPFCTHVTVIVSGWVSISVCMLKDVQWRELLRNGYTKLSVSLHYRKCLNTNHSAVVPENLT